MFCVIGTIYRVYKRTKWKHEMQWKWIWFIFYCALESLLKKSNGNNIYIYIERERERERERDGVTLSNNFLHRLIIFYWINISKILLLDCMFFMFLILTPSFMSIGCHLLFYLKSHLLCTILNVKTWNLNTWLMMSLLILDHLENFQACRVWEENLIQR